MAAYATFSAVQECFAMFEMALGERGIRDCAHTLYCTDCLAKACFLLYVVQHILEVDHIKNFVFGT